MYNDSWLKHGIRCQRGKAILDYQDRKLLLSDLNTQNESNNSYLLGESLRVLWLSSSLLFTQSLP